MRGFSVPKGWSDGSHDPIKGEGGGAVGCPHEGRGVGDQGLGGTVCPA